MGKGLAALGSTLAAVIGALWLALLNSEDFRDYVCPKVQSVPGHGVVCDRTYDPISDREAGEFFVRYYGSATAANASDAWNLLSPEWRGSDSFPGGRTEYQASLQPVLWTEVTGPPERTNDHPAEFTVQIRRFLLDGDVTPYRVLARLGRDEAGSIRMEWEDIETRTAGGFRGTYTWAYLPRAVDLRRFPRSDADITSPAKDQLPAGGRLRALCELDVPATGSAARPDGGWWTRTNQGWVSNEDLEVSGRRLGITTCSDYILGF
ncbi:hypothetical protein [Blastococcus sp. SYSU DS0973]